MIAVTDLNPYPIIAVASLVVSIITVAIMIFGQKHTMDTDYVAGLETRIETLERELKDCKQHVADLELQNGTLIKENIELLRKIAKM